MAIGFSADELILDAYYSGYTIPIGEFTQFYNPIHGNCYTFNSGWIKNVTLMKSSRAGRRYGLHVILNLNQNEYLPELGDTAGIRIVVHQKNRMAFPEDEGVTISPGHSTLIGLRKACKKTCYQKNVIKTCACRDPYLPIPDKSLTSKTIPVCRSRNTIQVVVVVVVVVAVDTLLSEDTSYTLELSIGQWPSNVQRNTVLNKLAAKIGKSFNISDTTAYKSNLAKVEMYFEEFNFELIKERAAYTAGNYISNLGGDLGLWVGFSFLTIAEFVEFGLDLIVLRCTGYIRVYRINKKCTTIGV
ncbi:hypothetical protein LSH36_313g01036 [Paralvinella palmiformis]|uniref:Uncharacterized protein n=1 Tax=Paralvinella palmiformis TaxID=53620 RepID=A0AAD9JGX3_9ANNE|nr:hypothetical protein LSH36_313g01036 [Paralvinella palmiformis]